MLVFANLPAIHLCLSFYFASQANKDHYMSVHLNLSDVVIKVSFQLYMQSDSY